MSKGVYVVTRLLLFKYIFWTFHTSKNAKKFNRFQKNESCDTEDWNNDAENSALRHRNK